MTDERTGDSAKGAVRVSLAAASGLNLAPVVVARAAPVTDPEYGGDGASPSGDPVAAWRTPAIRPLGSGEQPGTHRFEVLIDGWRFEVDVEPDARARLRERARRAREAQAGSGPAHVRAIIPGVVVSVAVQAGDRVTAGQELLVIEAMKMQNELRAPRAGAVQRIAAAPGQRIEVGDLLVVLE